MSHSTLTRDTTEKAVGHAGGGDLRARREEDSAPDGAEGFNDGARRLMRGDVRLLSACAALAFVSRFLLAWGVEHTITPDGVGYATLGRELMAGNFAGGLSAYWPPLYPLLVGLSSLVFDDIELAGRFVSVVAGSLLVLPVYALARVSYGVRVARLAALITALHPLLVYYSTLVLTEATYTLLFTCGVLAGWLALKGGRARAFLVTGAVFGTCYLLKPEAAAYLLLLLALLLGAKLFDKRLTASKALANCAALVAGFALLALPYVLYLRGATGRWTLSAKFGGHMWQGARRAGEAAPQSAPLLTDATTALVQLTKALRHEYEIFNLILPPVFVVLVGLALFSRGWTRERASRELYVGLFVAATLAGYAVTLPNIRFLVPLLPLAVCWAAKGAVEFEHWAAGTLERARAPRRLTAAGARLAVPLALALAGASLAPLFVYLVRGDKWSDYHGQKLAAAWIRRHSPHAAPRVMSTVPVAAFYAGGRHVALADEDYAAFVERARREGVDYVVINERNLKHMRLRQLLDDESPHDGLRLVHRIDEAQGHKILVYAPEAAGDGRQR